jgi:hypothetical protein
MMCWPGVNSFFLRNGGNIYTLQKLLGQTTLDMGKRYLAISQVNLDRDMDKASPVNNCGGYKLIFIDISQRFRATRGKTSYLPLLQFL